MTDVEPDAPAEDAPAPVSIDLDAMRAARAAESGVGPTVRFGGVDYELPARLPLTMLRNIGGLMRGTFLALEDTFTALLGADVAKQLFDTLDVDDARDFIDQVGAAYGVSLGNSAASNAS